MAVPAEVRKRPVAIEEDSAPPRKKLAAEAPPGAADPEQAAIVYPPHGPETFTGLGARLRDGHLVSFPTETVYGLGANGLDAQAVLKIFKAKGRPLSDPCILHVANAGQAQALLELDDLEQKVLEALAAACWPGPLSIVGRARPCVPPEVTASTGFVAVRCPDHPVARDLIAAAGVPLAAPSANRFGHISPTLPGHVLEDLGHVHGLRILDGGACTVGIESTVAKLEVATGRVVVLRKGGATRERLEAVLKDAVATGALNSRVAVEYSEKLTGGAEPPNESESQVSPGLLLRHYAPSVPTALLAPEPLEHASGEVLDYKVEGTVLVDFGQRMQPLHQHFLRAFDLCSEHTSQAVGSVAEAASRAFAVLRTAEAYAVLNKAKFICIVDFDAERLGGFAEALHDRMFRAASGSHVALCTAGGLHFVKSSG